MSEALASPALDAGAFASEVLNAPLWDHQKELLASPARYRCVVAGRQSGKSRALAVLSLFEAATRRGITVLLVSAGETASRRLLEEAAALAAGSPRLRGSVLDESKSALTLSNGSRILSVPASERQIRGWPVDLLVIDEAGFVSDSVWRAAEPAIGARHGRVVLASSPWGTPEHFFRRLWQRGMDRPDEWVGSFHWPSSISPLMDTALLEQIRQREAPDYFEREFLAVFTDDAGSYFKEAELTAAVADYELASLERARREEWNAYGPMTSGLVAGVDWGAARDSSALVVVGPLEDQGLNVNEMGGGMRLFVAAVEERQDGNWDSFITHCAEAAVAYPIWATVSERNGVGAWPTADLERRLPYGHNVAAAWTDTRRKMSGYGMIRGLLEQRALVLPAHSQLLSQLRALRFEQLPNGGMRIEVPESAGHDDVADALMTAMSGITLANYRDADYEALTSEEARLEYRRSTGLGNKRHEAEQAVSAGVLEYVETCEGFKVPRQPRPIQAPWWRWRQRTPLGMEKGDGF